MAKEAGAEDSSETFTFEQLAQYDGVKRPERYLSLLGQVFDVSKGRNAGMYEKPLPYSCFIGRDATTAFITGDFHGQKRPLSEAWDYSVLNAREMADATGWADFYRNHATYKFVGRLVYPDGNDPRLRAVDPYDPLVEQSGAVGRYRVGWVASDPVSWVARGLLRVNFKNEHGGIKACLFGTPCLWDDQVMGPPRTCWAADVKDDEAQTHSIITIWTKGVLKEDRTLDSQIKLSSDKPEVPEHFVFWGVNSSNKHFCGKDVPQENVRGSWVTPDEARSRLNLGEKDVLCLIFLWLDETLPAELPDKCWCPDTVLAVHFANVGLPDILASQGFVEPVERKKRSKNGKERAENCTTM